MPVRSEERDIGGTRYRLTQLGGEKASELGFRLLKALGSGLGDGATLNVVAALRVVQVDDFVLFRDAFAAVTDVLVEDSAKRAGVRARWMPLSTVGFDQHFAGRLRALADWMRWAFELNFSGFFDGPPAQGSPAEPDADPTPSSSGSPPASTGTSGGS